MFIVTGGGSGIGKALAQALASRGKSVLIIGRNKQSLCETKAFSPLIEYFCADVSTEEGRHCILTHLKSISRIDGLVHNAGVIEPILPLLTLDETQWRQVFATNLEAPLFLTQKLCDKLQNGRVLHIGSGAAYFPVTGWSAYCVSKAGLAMLTRCWQLELNTISFASVMPGIIDTNMQTQIRHAHHMENNKNDFFKKLKDNNQLLLPATVAIFLCWLLLDIDKENYISQEWDIYDISHHSAWLTSGHTVPALEK